MTVRRISLQSIRTQVGRGAAHFARISHHREKKLLKNFNFFCSPGEFLNKKADYFVTSVATMNIAAALSLLKLHTVYIMKSVEALPQSPEPGGKKLNRRCACCFF